MDMENLKVSSTAFVNNGIIPLKYTCDGDNVNPPLHITNIPEKTKSLVLIVDDLDAPMKTWLHWLVWDIEPSGRIEEDSVPGIEGSNDFRRNSYGGPCPPSGTHRYFFKMYAVDTKLGLKSGASLEDVEQGMKGHIIAQGQLMGKYSRY